ncbi:uncharacterized protein LOC132904346 [Amyelois transitella]|uniref:uncharacterized protein LOC132904346 n=1 Tax=Amyelois transitella TaxID=680683 RepID=UPI00299020B7|nr:uncharacterized protein LOC132904346 [Amyelois transitella]
MAAVNTSRRTIGQLLKQGWTEIPEVIASTGMALLGVGIGFYSCHLYEKDNGDNKRYKLTYVIMRPDDPKVKLIRKD